MLRVYYALSHIASQLIYKWLPPPLDHAGLANEDPVDACLQPEDLSEAQLRDLIRWERDRLDLRLPWLPLYMAKHDPGGCLLAEAFVRFFARIRDLDANWICPVDAAYPPLLALITDPPMGLSVLGDPSLLTRPLVSVVGSRKASALAVRESFELGKGLATAGITVVSGGALGCDIAAHHGVLAAGIDPAPAACIFAGGLAQLYPRANDFVFRRLRAQRAALISERLWESHCVARDFHARNRIIAGMSGLTVVMQAAIASGALVTARLAGDQGRDLAVLAHPEGDVRASGSVALELDGASTFPTAAALIERLTPLLRPSRDPENPLRS